MREALHSLRLPEESVVRAHVERALADLDAEGRRTGAGDEQVQSRAWELKLGLPGGSQRVVELPRGGETTVEELTARAAEEGPSGTGPLVIAGHRDARGTATLQSLGMENRSVVVLEPATTPAPAGLGSSIAGATSSTEGVIARLSKDSFEQLALALHSCSINQGFTCTGTGEEASTVRGFAPPVRDVPPEEWVPAGWNAVKGAAMFRYRRGDCPGKVFQMKVILMDGKVMVSFGMKGGDIESDEVEVEEPQWTPSNLSGILRRFEARILGRFVPAKEREPEPRREAPPTLPNPRPYAPPAADYDDDPLRVGPPRFPFPGGIPAGGPGYRGDFSGDLMPGGVGGFVPGLGPGGGSLMGPNHPMFSGGNHGQLPYAEVSLVGGSVLCAFL